MKYLLDSNTVSDIYNPSSGSHDSVIKKLLALEESDDIFISVDLMIAASALNHKTVLISADKIYKDIISLNAELELEDWTI